MNACPILTDAEIDDICKPLKQKAAQRRYLASLGLLVKPRANGRALVSRSEWERVMSSEITSDQNPIDDHAEPDVQALMRVLQKRERGQKTKAQST